MFYNGSMARRRIFGLICIGIVLLLSALAIFIKARTGADIFFEVVALDDGEVLFRRKVTPGDRFSTTFEHSVQLSDWTDFFEITEDYEFKVYETRFADMGWGFPSEPDPGAKIEMTPEYIRYYDMDRRMKSFEIGVQTENDRHFLEMDGFLVDFVKEAGPGRRLLFRIKP